MLLDSRFIENVKARKNYRFHVKILDEESYCHH